MSGNQENRFSFSIAVLRNTTVEALTPLCTQMAGEYGIELDIEYGGFDTAIQDVYSGNLVNIPRDLYIVQLSKLSLFARISDDFSELSDEQVGNELDSMEQAITTLLQQITLKAPQAGIAVHSFEAYPYPLKKPSDCGYNCQNTVMTEANRRLQHLLANCPQAFEIDNDLILRRLGADQFYDWRYWYFARAPYSQATLKAFTAQYFFYIKQRMGMMKKCLVLDCDNTLWGGIIGEDGLKGIHLSNEGKGLAFRQFQKYLNNLGHSGILLALCSKNNENDVWSVLENHPSSVLRREQIAAYRINWQSKEQNLIEIANELNIGLDSFVFVDDSEFECNLIRSALPQVDVIRVDPRNPSVYIPLLQKSGLFYREKVLTEDLQKTGNYQQQQQRTKLKSALSLEDYFYTLETRINIRTAKESDLTRLAQMSQKTNQFNLTTERLTEHEVNIRFQDDLSQFYVLAVKDRYGDLGIVGYIDLSYSVDRKTVTLRNIAISCRVLGRRIEIPFLNTVLDHLKFGNCEIVVASYIATPKNPQVKTYYSERGFVLEKESETEALYQLKLKTRFDTKEEQTPYITVTTDFE